MAYRTKSAELNAEILRLRKEHLNALGKATFCGFTPEEEDADQERVQQLASLLRRLEALHDFPK